MGILYRSGDYIKFVRFGHRTVKDGEAAVVWNARGQSVEIIGPRRVTLWYSTIRFLFHCQATRGQYLKVEYRDGKVDHIIGPVAMYQNPTVHKAVSVLDGYNLATEDDCLVMYGSGNAASEKIQADRRVIYGPQFVIPSEKETVHKFHWSSAGDGQATDFEVVNTGKVELWKKNLSLKTKDGLTVAVILAISYKIEAIEKCLNIADPIAQLEAAILCDASNARLSMDEVIDAAGLVSTYPTFQDTASSCGFRIKKIHAMDVAMPKTLIEREQREKREVEDQVNASARLERKIELGKLEFDKKRREAEEKAALEKMQNQLQNELTEQAREIETSSVENELLIDKMRRDATNANTEKENQIRLEYLRGLQEIGVDVTKVLCAEVAASSQGERKKRNAGTNADSAWESEKWRKDKPVRAFE